MKKEIIENLTIENAEFTCYITRKEVSNGETTQKFFDKIKIERNNDKKKILSLSGNDSEEFMSLCQKIVDVVINPQPQQAIKQSPQQQGEIIPLTTANLSAFTEYNNQSAPGLPPAKKVNVYEVKSNPDGITTVVQTNRKEQEMNEIEQAKRLIETKMDNPTEQEMLINMAKEFHGLSEKDLPPEKLKELNEKKKKHPSFFNRNK